MIFEFTNINSEIQFLSTPSVPPGSLHWGTGGSTHILRLLIKYSSLNYFNFFLFNKNIMFKFLFKKRKF